MNEEHTKKLYKDFPNLYKQHNLSMQETCMCWGFECGDGWFDLIYDLSKKIVKLDPKVEAEQVKEKFGSLRYYINRNKNDKVFKLIDEYEKKSGKICENCGKRGKPRCISGWFSTLCNKCCKEKKEKSNAKDTYKEDKKYIPTRISVRV